jgi:quercetin dioxygenase-like cupin family protein
MTKKISEAVADGKILTGRTPSTPAEAFDGVFQELRGTKASGVFVGRFEGTSAWERHPGGDEFVQIVDGTVTLSLLHDDGRLEELALETGHALVVPQGVWHRFNSPAGVTVLTMTPRVPPTEHLQQFAPPAGN